MNLAHLFPLESFGDALCPLRKLPKGEQITIIEKTDFLQYKSAL